MPPSAAADPPFTTPLHDAAFAGALGDLGLSLLRHQSAASVSAQVNKVVSPISVSAAMGLVHAGAAGDSAREIEGLLSPAGAGDSGFARRLPSVLARLESAGGPLAVANRAWLDRSVSSSVASGYAALIQGRYAADADVLSFESADAARVAINQWVASRTANRIPALLPVGSVEPGTRLVVTSAIHFRSPWLKPFDAKATAPRPFAVAGGPPRAVATMIGVHEVRRGTVDNIDVIELPFAGGAHALLVGMPPRGHTLDAFEKDLAGLDIASWTQQLKPQTCRLELPKFSIGGSSMSLKAALRSLGVKTVFSDAADLQPMLGEAGRSLRVDDVVHAATVVIDERGGEASAATGAAVEAKAFVKPVSTCAVDRPFVFAIVHTATGAPLFLGKLADPSAAG
jgi:serpin B